MKPGRNETINMGKWKGNVSCPDPMILFESIVFKLDDLVERITYEFFEEESQGIQNKRVKNDEKNFEFPNFFLTRKFGT